MDTHKVILGDVGQLRSFKYWSVSIVRDLNHPGHVVIHTHRSNVKRWNGLTTEERLELYDTIVPRVERMIESVINLGQIEIIQQWIVNSLYLMPKTTGGRTSFELLTDYRRALNAASA